MNTRMKKRLDQSIQVGAFTKGLDQSIQVGGFKKGWTNQYKWVALQEFWTNKYKCSGLKLIPVGGFTDGLDQSIQADGFTRILDQSILVGGFTKGSDQSVKWLVLKMFWPSNSNLLVYKHGFESINKSGQLYKNLDPSIYVGGIIKGDDRYKRVNLRVNEFWSSQYQWVDLQNAWSVFRMRL